MQWKFANTEHERLYNTARAMLEAECDRQKREWERFGVEWERYPLHIRTEKRAWLYRHFAKCREPYENILTEIVSICPMTISLRT
jgi:hypothetical protein